MIKKLFEFIIFIVFLYFVLLSIQPLRYYIWYPTITAYPNNGKEIQVIIRDYISKRTQEDIDFFKLTDPSPLEAFRRKIPAELFKRLKEEIISPLVSNKIMYYKKLYNRARPEQVAPELIDALFSRTSDTPAFPSGHSFQGYYAAKLLSKWEPDRKKEWDEIADRIANIRIIGGIHYPSDIEFAKKLVDKM
jgi:membrane-associated phospholipid phosphatase